MKSSHLVYFLLLLTTPAFAQRAASFEARALPKVEKATFDREAKTIVVEKVRSERIVERPNVGLEKSANEKPQFERAFTPATEKVVIGEKAERLQLSKDLAPKSITAKEESKNQEYRSTVRVAAPSRDSKGEKRESKDTRPGPQPSNGESHNASLLLKKFNEVECNPNTSSCLGSPQRALSAPSATNSSKKQAVPALQQIVNPNPL